MQPPHHSGAAPSTAGTPVITITCCVLMADGAPPCCALGRPECSPGSTHQVRAWGPRRSRMACLGAAAASGASASTSLAVRKARRSRATALRLRHNFASDAAAAPCRCAARSLANRNSCLTRARLVMHTTCELGLQCAGCALETQQSPSDFPAARSIDTFTDNWVHSLTQTSE